MGSGGSRSNDTVDVMSKADTNIYYNIISLHRSHESVHFKRTEDGVKQTINRNALQTAEENRVINIA